MESGKASDEQLGRSALRKASWRLLPLLFLGYGIAYVDRVNIGFASLQMNEDLHFSATIYGLGGGLFFLSYALCEIPSNLLLVRFGARRWIARIMLTWGAISVGMMFVRTPLQFYCMRFLLGMAEAGFFPGVLFYLTQWFPTAYRGRAISRFYVAMPLSVAVMGAVAGSLLDLRGRLGLAGWQWLFLVEGLPAIALGLVILTRLPDGPERAPWLTPAQRDWIRHLLADAAERGAPDHSGVLRVLLDRRVWWIGICNMCILGTNYAFTLSAPAVLKGATHWSAGAVGYLMAGSAVLGAFAMLLNGADSDRRRERHYHTVIPLAAVAGAFLVMGLATASWWVVSAYIVYFVGMCAVQASFWLIPSDELHGRDAAVGLAAIGSIGMLGSFIGPYAWGLAKDYTGNYRGGFIALAVFYGVAALILVLFRQIARPLRPINSIIAVSSP
jgi:MFS transporter, ACS family, tartrate transporter